MRHALRVATAALALTVATGLSAQTFSTGVGTDVTSRGSGSGPGQPVNVLSTVTISEFGFWISGAQNVNMKFMIWDRTAPSPIKVFETQRVVTSTAQSLQTTGAISVLLQGGRSYSFAIIGDGGYGVSAFFGGPNFSGNGFSITARNDNYGPFAEPAFQGDAGATIAVAIWTGPANVVPEPSTYVLLASGLAGLAALSRRRRSNA